MAKRRRRAKQEHTPLNYERIFGGARRETKNGFEWFVRTVPVDRALKVYTCPSCHQNIPARQSHVVVWRADGIFGDDDSVQDRRHWHSHCWRMER